MKKTVLVSMLFAFAASACADKINYDPEYVYAEALKCNLAPLNAIEKACKNEMEAGAEHKPGCDTKSSIKVWDLEGQLGFSSKYKPLPKCAP